MACVDCFKEANPDFQGCYYNPRALEDACEKHLRENVVFWKEQVEKSEPYKEKHPQFHKENVLFYEGWLGELQRRDLGS